MSPGLLEDMSTRAVLYVAILGSLTGDLPGIGCVRRSSVSYGSITWAYLSVKHGVANNRKSNHQSNTSGIL